MRSWPLTLGVLLFVALTGALDLARPPGGDQSLFLTGAKEMAQGAALYRDFWDLKQPGIYDFYYAAGQLGGFTILSVHVFELVYLLVFAWVLVYANGRSATFRPAAALVPLFAIAGYFIFLGDREQTQVEGLAGFPIFICAWLACEGAAASGRTRYLAFAGAGFAAACALILKLIFAPLLALVFIAAMGFGSDAYRSNLRALFAATGAALLGAALPMFAALAVLARQDALGLALATWFSIPSRIVATLPHQNTAVLVDGVSWFGHAYAVALFFAAIGVFAIARSGKVDPLARCYVVWIVAGAFTVVAQRTSWWGYQWLLIAVPLGAFAAAGVAAAWRSPLAFARPATLVVAALAIAYEGRIEIGKIRPLAAHHFALRADDREAYRDDVSPNYAGARHDAAFLPPGAGVYVMGNPTFYVVANRTQPLTLNGWGLELLLPEQSAELLRELQARAPAYIYMSDDDAGPRVALARYPALGAYFSHAYRSAHRGEFGTLFRLSARR